MRGATFLLLVLLLAGCATPGAPSGRVEPGAPAHAQPAPGCDASRPAVAHHAGGAPASAPATFVPCMARVGSGALEPTLGVDPKSGAVYYYPVGLAGGTGALAISRSTDGGRTWTHVYPGVAGRPDHVSTNDPYFYLDPATGRLFADDLYGGACSLLSFSDDASAWTSSVTGCTQTDHQTIFAGAPRGSTTLGYADIVYRCAINGGAAADASTASTCTKSLDGGLHFQPTGEPAFLIAPPDPHCDGGLGHGVAGKDGTIFLPKGVCGVPMLAISKDEGASWSRVRVAPGPMADSEGHWEHEASVGQAADGTLAYAWLAQDRLPRLSVSRDGGATWSAPVVAAAPGVREAALLEMAVAPSGRVALAYMGSVDSPGMPWPSPPPCTNDIVACLDGLQAFPAYANVTWRGYLTLTDDATDADPLFVSAAVDAPNDTFQRGACGPIRCSGPIGDFLDVRFAGDGTPWAAFVDGCVGACEAPGGKPDEHTEGIVGWLHAINSPAAAR